MSNAFASAGTVISRGLIGGGVGQTYTPVAEVVDCDGPSLSSSFIDVTHLTSPDNTKEFIPSLKDSGSVRLSMNFVPTDGAQSPSTGFLADRAANPQVLRWYKIEFSNTGTDYVEFQAYVEEFSISSRMGDKTSAQVTLKISGPCYFAT